MNSYKLEMHSDYVHKYRAAVSKMHKQAVGTVQKFKYLYL